MALPIKLTNFNAAINGNAVALNWQVENDLSTNYFEIEKSSDGQNFEAIGKINGSATEAARRYYFADAKVLNATIYYRLKMVDKDGSFQYSKTILVGAKNTGSYVNSVYPNPVKAGQNITVEIVAHKEQTATLNLFNSHGKLISSKQKTVAAGFNSLSVLYSNYLAVGNYYLVVQLNNQNQKPIALSIVE